MAKTETQVNNLKINEGTYEKIQENILSIGENELIITDDKNLPIPTTSDNGKVVGINASGEFEFTEKMTNPMTTVNDIIVAGVDGVPNRLEKGNIGQILGINNDGNVAYVNQVTIANGVAYEIV